LHGALAGLGLDRYGSITYRSSAPDPSNPSWSIYGYDTADCRCIDGGPYFVSARTAAASGRVVFVLEGGGACWPGKEACTRSADPRGGGDALTSEESPFAGWSVVYAPYCDGSVHMGDHDADYDGDGIADHYHRGLRATAAAVNLMRELHPAPEKIAVTGCSAGGYGTMVAALLVRFHYPRTPIYVFSESGPGLFNPEDRNTWQIILDTWNVGYVLPSSCPRCRDQLLYIFDWLLDRDGLTRVGIFCSYRDEVISQSYLEMEPRKFETLLRRTCAGIHDRHPSAFKRYFVRGSGHCVPDYGYVAGGVSVFEWVRRLVENDPGWGDVME
jgi:hypothetical protein